MPLNPLFLLPIPKEEELEEESRFNALEFYPSASFLLTCQLPSFRNFLLICELLWNFVFYWQSSIRSSYEWEELRRLREREIERWREECVGGVFVYLFIWGAMALLSFVSGYTLMRTLRQQQTASRDGNLSFRASTRAHHQTVKRSYAGGGGSSKLFLQCSLASSFGRLPPSSLFSRIDSSGSAGEVFLSNSLFSDQE